MEFKKEKKVAYLYWHCYEWQEFETGKIKILFDEADNNLENLTLIKEFEIMLPDYKIPAQVEVNANRIKHLRIQRDAIQSQAFLDSKAIEDKIQNLLALPSEV